MRALARIFGVREARADRARPAPEVFAVSGSICTGGYGWQYGGYWYPYYQPIYYPVYQDAPRRPIKLTMGEVERLRVAAKKDKDLKATLEKFTDHIEVIVDFGKKD